MNLSKLKETLAPYTHKELENISDGDAVRILSKAFSGALCPLCQSRLEHETIENTHIYKCMECPFVGLEYYTDRDMMNLSKSIK